LAQEGYPESACIETMMETGLSRMIELHGSAHTASYLDQLREQTEKKQRELSDLLRQTALNEGGDTPFIWDGEEPGKAA
jgi:hypothetical protein